MTHRGTFYQTSKTTPCTSLCRLPAGLHFSGWPDPSKKNESERRPSKKNITATADRHQTRIECRTNSKFSKSVVYVIWNCVREFWLCSNSAGCYNEPLFLIFYSDDSILDSKTLKLLFQKRRHKLTFYGLKLKTAIKLSRIMFFSLTLKN